MTFIIWRHKTESHYCICRVSKLNSDDIHMYTELVWRHIYYFHYYYFKRKVKWPNGAWCTWWIGLHPPHRVSDLCIIKIHRLVAPKPCKPPSRPAHSQTMKWTPEFFLSFERPNLHGNGVIPVPGPSGHCTANWEPGGSLYPLCVLLHGGWATQQSMTLMGKPTQWKLDVFGIYIL